MQTNRYPRFDIPSADELDHHLAHGRALRSEAAFAFFATLARRVAQGFEITLGRAIHGIRHRETTHWPAPPLRHGRI